MNGPTKRNNDTDDMITDRCLKCGLKKTVPWTVAIKTKSSVVPIHLLDIKIIIVLRHRDLAKRPSQIK